MAEAAGDRGLCQRGAALEAQRKDPNNKRRATTNWHEPLQHLGQGEEEMSRAVVFVRFQ